MELGLGGGGKGREGVRDRDTYRERQRDAGDLQSGLSRSKANLVKENQG